jgi:hypothetical protein
VKEKMNKLTIMDGDVSNSFSTIRRIYRETGKEALNDTNIYNRHKHIKHSTEQPKIHIISKHPGIYSKADHILAFKNSQQVFFKKLKSEHFLTAT